MPVPYQQLSCIASVGSPLAVLRQHLAPVVSSCSSMGRPFPSSILSVLCITICMRAACQGEGKRQLLHPILKVCKIVTDSMLHESLQTQGSHMIRLCGFGVLVSVHVGPIGGYTWPCCLISSSRSGCWKCECVMWWLLVRACAATVVVQSGVIVAGTGECNFAVHGTTGA